MSHTPVLLKETIAALNPISGEFFIDGTLGGGGHAAEILKRILPDGKLLGVDLDGKGLLQAQLKISAEIKNQKSNIKNNLILVNDNFANISGILKREKLPKADGIILDLGFSSDQIDSTGWQMGRGFSFRKDEELLMTYGDSEKPVYEWLSELKEKQLAEIIKDFGEEKYAERIAKAIKKSLPIMMTLKLAEVVKKAVPSNYEHGRIHPATRTFMALRIFANHEFENISSVIRNLPDILTPGGRAAIISFHSLEDKIVKNEFRNLVKNKKADFINKKPITASEKEVLKNPRSRSAKLRGIRMI